MWNASSDRPTNLWYQVLVLLEWHVLNTEKATKIKMTETPYRLGLLKNSPESWLWGWPTKLHPGKCTLWMVETTENILIGYKAKLSGYRKKMKGKISACLSIGDPQQSLSKQMPVWWETLTSQSVRPVWTPGYRAMPAFCPIVFPPYDNDKRQRQTVTISEKKRLNARVTMSRELILKAFFPGNLNLEREKRDSHYFPST